MSKKQAPKRGAKRAKNAATERGEASPGKGSAIKSRENLRPWKPGQSGNPTGAPPGYVPYATAYRIAVTLADDELEILKTGKYPSAWPRERCQTYNIAAAAVLKMRSDAPPALMSEVADRSDGKVPQTVRATVDVQGIICLPAGPSGLAWTNVVDAHLVDAARDTPKLKSASDREDES